MEMVVRLDGNLMAGTGAWSAGGLFGPGHYNVVGFGIFNWNERVWRQVAIGWDGVHMSSLSLVDGLPRETNISIVGGTYNVNSVFRNNYALWDFDIDPPITVGNSADLTFKFEKIPVGADGTVKYEMSMQTRAEFKNVYNGTVTYAGARNSTSFENTARLSAVHAFDASGNDISSKYTFTLASGETIPSVPQGCGQGYWKNHESSWPATYPQSVKFNAVFNVTWADPNLTLGAALKLQGGQLNELARQAVAALLNAAHTGINSLYSVSQVINLVQAKDTGALIAANSLGCPLN
jgi:hypothetical protein